MTNRYSVGAIVSRLVLGCVLGIVLSFFMAWMCDLIFHDMLLSGLTRQELFHDLRFVPLLFACAGVVLPVLGVLIFLQRRWFGGFLFFNVHLLVSLLSLWAYPLVIVDGRVIEVTWQPLFWALIGGCIGICAMSFINTSRSKGLV